MSIKYQLRFVKGMHAQQNWMATQFAATYLPPRLGFAFLGGLECAGICNRFLSSFDRLGLLMQNAISTKRAALAPRTKNPTLP